MVEDAPQPDEISLDLQSLTRAVGSKLGHLHRACLRHVGNAIVGDRSEDESKWIEDAPKQIHSEIPHRRHENLPLRKRF